MKKYKAIILTMVVMFSLQHLSLGVSGGGGAGGGGGVVVGGGGKSGGGSSAPKASATPIPQFHTVIGSVSTDSITVKKTKESKTYKITKNTTITFENKTVTAADLKAGMRVVVSVDLDGVSASSIAASKAPAQPSPTPKK